MRDAESCRRSKEMMERLMHADWAMLCQVGRSLTSELLIER